MSEIVSEHEHGVVRVFLASYNLSMDISHSGTYDLLCKSFGIDWIDHKDVQQVGKAALDGMPLADFLITAYDIDPAEIAPHAAALNALDGMVLIIRSSAFKDRPVTLKTNNQAKLIATFKEPDTATTIILPLMSNSADGILTPPPVKKKPSDAAMGGRVATVALLVMGLLVWLMIKVAG